MVVARVIDPASKLATARQLDAMTAPSSLGALLGLGTVSEQELYPALDWLLSHQPHICQRAPNFPSKWALNIPWSGGWYEVGGQACW
jgi:hypothetical protein